MKKKLIFCIALCMHTFIVSSEMFLKLHTLPLTIKQLENGAIISLYLLEKERSKKKYNIYARFPCSRCCRSFNSLRAWCGHQRMHK